MTVVEIAEARTRHTLRQLHEGANPPLVLLDPARLEITARWQGCTLQDIARKSRAQAVVLRHPTRPEASTVWAERSVADYGSVFHHFLTEVYGLANPSVPRSLDIDHLRAKALTPPGFLIRLEMVPSGANRSHGAAYEQRMAASTVTQGRMARGHVPGGMTFFMALKLAGFSSLLETTGPTATRRRTEAVGYFMRQGWTRTEIETALDSLETLADRRAVARAH